MAKRFTATDKWDKVWFRKLSPEYKCLWDFMLSKCDLAGIWEVDFESAEHYIGKPVDVKKAKEFFAEQIHVLNSKKWFIVDFVPFQYGDKPLNLKSPIHIKIIEILDKHSLYDRVGSRVLCTLKEEEEEKEEVKELVKVEVKVRGKHLFENSEFFDLAKFDLALQSDKQYSPFDSYFYYESIKNWSAEGNSKKDWISTAKNWMLRDLKDGKPKLKQQYQKHFNNGKSSNAPTTPDELLRQTLALADSQEGNLAPHLDAGEHGEAK